MVVCEGEREVEAAIGEGGVGVGGDVEVGEVEVRGEDGFAARSVREMGVGLLWGRG